jgi:hypothetical protein
MHRDGQHDHDSEQVTLDVMKDALEEVKKVRDDLTCHMRIMVEPLFADRVPVFCIHYGQWPRGYAGAEAGGPDEA